MGLKGTATLSRNALVRGLNMAADVMQNSAAVAKSETWKGYYRSEMNAYRLTAHLVENGAKLSILSERKGKDQ